MVAGSYLVLNMANIGVYGSNRAQYFLVELVLEPFLGKRVGHPNNNLLGTLIQNRGIFKPCGKASFG